jgi:peptidyl-prolyl cis-trans isomerase SurA
MNLRILGRLRITDDDVALAYQKLVADERKQLDFRAAWIRISAPRSLPAEVLRERRALADRVYMRARQGDDFAELARKYSDDTATRDAGGLLAPLHPGQLSQALDSVTQLLEVGDVSEPIRQGDDFVVLKLIERSASKIPAFDEAKNELRERVYMEKMNTARRRYLEGLRRQTHVEIRL